MLVFLLLSLVNGLVAQQSAMCKLVVRANQQSYVMSKLYGPWAVYFPKLCHLDPLFFLGRASNCASNETCVGHCLRRKSVDYCHGQCLEKVVKCVDTYRYLSL